MKPPAWAVVPHTDTVPGVEVRLNEDGTIDEVVSTRLIKCFHLEQMDDGQYWIGLSFEGSDDVQHIMLTRKGKGIYPTVYQ